MQNTTDVKKGLVLIAHGSRESETQNEMNELVVNVQSQLPQYLVAGSYMEIQSPDLKTVIADLVVRGVSEIEVFPLFIFRGRHMKADIPAQIDECRSLYDNCQISLRPHLAVSDAFARLIVASV